jgi:hypothetical protein
MEYMREKEIKNRLCKRAGNFTRKKCQLRKAWKYEKEYGSRVKIRIVDRGNS